MKTKIALVLGLAIFLTYCVAYSATVTRGTPQYLYQWYTTRPDVAGVHPQTGLVTPVWTGKADICAQLKSDLSVKFCNTVTVQ